MHYRTKSGIDIAYRARGSGRLLMFLHPIGMRGEFWQPVIEELGDGFRTLAIDLRGHGESKVNDGPFSLDDLSDDVAELIGAEGEAGTVVIGCSLGGMVAQGVAIKIPHLLGGLVLAGTSHKQTPESQAMMEKRSAEALGGMSSIAAATLDRWFPKAFRDARPDVVETVRGWLLAADATVFSRGWQAIRDLNYEAQLPKIELPALLIRGSEDASTPLPRMQAMADLIPHGSFISMSDVGHFAPMQEPGDFATLVRDFVQGEVARA
jgi:3-oxoadipate enol-lactonase